MRLIRELSRLAVLGAMAALAGAGPWPLVVAGLPVLLREIVLLVGFGLGQVRWLRVLAPLNRLARHGMAIACFLTAAALVQAGAENFLTAAAIPPRLSSAKLEVEVRDERAWLRIEGAVELELAAATDEDQLVAMVLLRQFRGKNDRPLLTHGVIAKAFGKKNRQDSSNHVASFKRAGGSIAQMVLNIRGGRPTRLSSEIRELLVGHWERNPLASMEETHQWLAKRELPAGVSLPSLDELRALRHLPGNLILARNAMHRLVERRGGQLTLALRPLHWKLLEIIERQAQRLRDAGLDSVPLPSVVKLVRRPATRRISKTGAALLATLRPLLRAAAPEEDEALAAAVGTEHLAPLHWGLLYCNLRLSIGQVATLAGKSKSVVYRGLTRLTHLIESLDPFPPAAHFSGVLALDEKWVRIPKSFSKSEREKGKKWRYVHFAVDANTGDLLHVDVFEKTDADSILVFLLALRARGIQPKVVVTDMLGAYDNAIRAAFGKRVVHHYCLFHHLQAVRHRLRDRCGNDWSQKPRLRRLVEQVDLIYRCRTRRTARRRLNEVLAMRDELALHHPEAVPVLDIIKKRFSKVVNAVGRPAIPSTNNVTERTIKAFAQHYKQMAGFESLETARIQVALFRFFYRLKPMRDAVRAEHRGLSPLERAGWNMEGVPVADYIRCFTMGQNKDGPGPTDPSTNACSDAEGKAAA